MTRQINMKSILSILLALLILSCESQKDNSTTDEKEFDLEPLKSQIGEANKFYGDRFIKGDLTWYQERYCKDACAMPANHNSVCGIGAIKEFYYNEGKNKEINVVIEASDIYGRDSVIIEEGTYSYPDGKGGSFDNGKFIAIWKQEDGVWKIYREIWNSNVEPASKE
jgi:ketosteroid isomerase-like protein